MLPSTKTSVMTVVDEVRGVEVDEAVRGSDCRRAGSWA
jgi:hypothetical protein